MKQVTVTVVDPVGLHARPATVAVNAASKFKSEINVAFKGRESQHSLKSQSAALVKTKKKQLLLSKKYFAHRKLLLNV